MFEELVVVKLHGLILNHFDWFFLLLLLCLLNYSSEAILYLSLLLDLRSLQNPSLGILQDDWLILVFLGFLFQLFISLGFDELSLGRQLGHHSALV